MHALIRDVFRAGTAAGVAMIPFAAIFRALDLRVNEYGRKTLEWIAGPIEPPGLHFGLTLVQHMIISWTAAVPFLIAVRWIPERRAHVVAGVVYGAGFYVVMNSLALPWVFGDPTPWVLGFETVYPSLTIHLVYGFVLGWLVAPKEA